MPERTTVERAKRDLRAGKRPTTAAGEFVREEMEHIRRGRHGARNTQQAIAIGLSKARRAGVPLQPPAPSQAKERTRKAAERDYEAGQGRRTKASDSRGTTASGSRKRRASSHTRGKASSRALKREGRAAASPRALSAHAKATASRRTRRSPAH